MLLSFIDSSILRKLEAEVPPQEIIFTQALPNREEGGGVKDRSEPDQWIFLRQC